MKYASTLTVTSGPAPVLLRAEVNARRGIPHWSLDGSVRTMERIRACLIQSGYAPPFASVLGHLTPAGHRIEPQMDLALALSALAALELLSLSQPDGCVAIGALSLSGTILPVDDLVSMLLCAKRAGCTSALVPESQKSQAVVPGLQYFFLRHLADLGEDLARLTGPHVALPAELLDPGLAYLRVPAHVQRAAAIAAAGWHSILLSGPPGTGKTSCARTIAALLPPPDQLESLEIRALHPEMNEGIVRPVRMPHHSITPAALLGGGVPVRAGEVTKAHNGMLILDELAEFSRPSLQALREPMQDGAARISRGNSSTVLPARFLLAATTNPCPCGYRGTNQCSCAEVQARAYLRKITGPLLDRIDLEVAVESSGDAEISALDLRKKIAPALQMQADRFRKRSILHSAGRLTEKTPIRFNGRMPADRLFELIDLSEEAKRCLGEMRTSSQRKLHSLLRVARTIADLAASEEVSPSHLLEASYYSCSDYVRVNAQESASIPWRYD